MPYIVTSRNTSFRIPFQGDKRVFAPRSGYEAQMYGAIVPAISATRNLAPRNRSNPTIRVDATASIEKFSSTPFGVGAGGASDIMFTTTTAPPATGSTLLVMGYTGTVSTDTFIQYGRSVSAVYTDVDGSVSASITNSSSVPTAATSSAGLITDNSLAVIVGKFVTGATAKVYFNGKNVASSAGAWNGTALASGSFQLSIGATGLSAALIGIGWYRALSDAEILDVSINWPQLFRPLTPVIYSFPSSVTIPTLSSATVTNITSSGATPRVTVTF